MLAIKVIDGDSMLSFSYLLSSLEDVLKKAPMIW